LNQRPPGYEPEGLTVPKTVTKYGDESTDTA